MITMLNELMDRRGITDEQLARRIGAGRSTVTNWRHGVHCFSFEQACQIADILHCTLDELAGRAPATLTDDEHHIVDSYRRANAQGKAAISAVADASRGMEMQPPSREMKAM